MSDWQFSCKDVKERGAQILELGQWADCTFLVGRDHEKTRFPAHKLFLSMASPVFDCMLNGPLGEDFIEILDVRPEAFKTLLQYIYTDKINIESYNHACDLYYSANKYMLPYLIGGCIQYLRDNLTPQNVCQIYEFSKMFDETELTNECIELIIMKTKELISDPSFIDTKLSTVKEILKFKILNIDNEVELYFAVEKYSKCHAKDEISICDSVQDDQVNSSSSDTKSDLVPETTEALPKTSPSSSESNNENSFAQPENNYNRDEINNEIFRVLIQEVRLLTLTPQEFAENVALSPFITKSESYALLMNICSCKTEVPIPKGFNTSYIPRYKLEVDPERNIDLGLRKDKERPETTFRFVTSNICKSMFISLPFYVRGLSWRIAVNPKGKNDDDQKYFGIYLYCCWVNKSAQWSCPAKADISFVLNKPNVRHLVKRIEHVFTSKENNRGSKVLFETILNSQQGYIKDNTFTIEVHVVAEEPANVTSKQHFVKT